MKTAFTVFHGAPSADLVANAGTFNLDDLCAMIC